MNPDCRETILAQLSPEDRAMFESLRRELEEPTNKNRRNKSTELFGDVIARIKQYVVRGDEDEWKRAFVCGICWINDTIAINTRHLRLLVVKCKSSINNYFKNMNYGTVPAGSEAGTALARYFPFLKDDFGLMRQWSVRKKISCTPQPTNTLPFQQFELQPVANYVTPPPPVQNSYDLLDGFGPKCELGFSDSYLVKGASNFEHVLDGDDLSMSKLDWPSDANDLDFSAFM